MSKIYLWKNFEKKLYNSLTKFIALCYLNKARDCEGLIGFRRKKTFKNYKKSSKKRLTIDIVYVIIDKLAGRVPNDFG